MALAKYTPVDPFTNYSLAGVSAVGRGLNSLSEAVKEGQQKNALAELGAKIQTGDYGGAADIAFKAGDVKTGLELTKLGQSAKTGTQFDQLYEGLGGLGGGGASFAPTPSGATTSPTAPGGAKPAMRMPADPEIENRFVATLREGGLTNPVGLAAFTAYANAESGFSPKNITGSWADPSQSGQPGTSGGILSWRGPRLDAMRQATAGSQDPVAAQAKFALTENPNLTMALQNAKSPEEANRLLANAWRFAGFDQPGGEYARRLAMTQNYVGRLGGGSAVPTAAAAAPVRVASAATTDNRPAWARPVGDEPGAFNPEAQRPAVAPTAPVERTPSDAYGLDAGTIGRFRLAAKYKPDTPATQLAGPEALNANPDLFVAGGQPLTAAQVVAKLDAAAPPAADRNAPTPSAAPDWRTAQADDVGFDAQLADARRMTSGPAGVVPVSEVRPPQRPVEAAPAAVPVLPPARPANAAVAAPVAISAAIEGNSPDGGAREFLRTGGAVAAPARVAEPMATGSVRPVAASAPTVAAPVQSAGAPAPIAPAAQAQAQSVPQITPEQASAAAPQAVVQAGFPQSAGAALQNAQSPEQRMRILMNMARLPGLDDGRKNLLEMLFKAEQAKSKVPDSVAEFVWAKNNGMTQARSPAEYAREKEKPEKDEGAKARDTASARHTIATEQLGLKPGTSAYKKYLAEGKYEGEETPGMFGGNSVEGQALNELVRTNQLTREQAAQFGAGKTVTNPADGSIMFMTPQGIFGRPASGGEPQPVIPFGGGTPSPTGPTQPPPASPRPIQPSDATAQPQQREGMIQLTPPKTEKPTEGQSGSALYARRMEDADRILTDPRMQAAQQARRNQIVEGLPLPDGAKQALASDDYNTARQAELNFLTAILRKESGASISPTEFETAARVYFPRPSDTPEQLANKAKARADAIEGIRGAAGPAYKAPAPQAAPQRPSNAVNPSIPEGATATNPKTGARAIYRGGQWVPFQ